MKKPELLAPAGNLEKLKIALTYGADAVFLGGKAYGLRAFSDNFTDDDVREAVAYAHALGRRVYVTVNIIPHNEDLVGLPEYIRFLSEAGVDALIVSDPGIFSVARSVAPKLPLHISTQANNTNWASAQFWQSQGAKRIVLARELSLSEIRGIREKTQVELEAFVHGAMCISYSGRCLLSNYLTGRDANRGECAQACRWKYSVVEETRPGQYFPVLEDERGAYVFNSRDLCMLPHIGDLIAAGLDSFKIEGRMKSVHYVATVVKVYREAIDTYFADPSDFVARPEWLTELAKISHRAYTTGFAFAKTTEADQIYGDRTYHQTHDFVGLVHSYDPVSKTAIVEQRNNMKTGEEIEIMQPGQSNFQQIITRMTDVEGNEISVAPHAQQLVRMDVQQPVAPFSMLRRQVSP
ncbi:peptidase U32 [Anaerosporomusa subterranea]|uniref:Peptidase U32 n=1 Tax=Anaerosporomusa subterranea TaxID=1794912 RepID=A0A154BUF8_ANASB|nr:U32 family peptidase [Anaerosporomusa subterranea]KYZ77537.1 peptidase U32 [Anaerosporomusa subterranea]